MKIFAKRNINNDAQNRLMMRCLKNKLKKKKWWNWNCCVGWLFRDVFTFKKSPLWPNKMLSAYLDAFNFVDRFSCVLFAFLRFLRRTIFFSLSLSLSRFSLFTRQDPLVGFSSIIALPKCCTKKKPFTSTAPQHSFCLI